MGEWELKNKELKRKIVEISYKLGLSHLGSCLSVVDLIADIYEKKNPDDKFVLSMGHAHLAHLVVQEAIYDPEFWPLDSEESIKKYGIHCDRKAGCDVSTGSLGHGIGIALGMALANPDIKVYCIISDGECSEGSVWEAFRIQKELNVDNLIIYVSVNGWGAYKKINGANLSQQIKFMSRAKPVNTTLLEFPKWMRGQEAHYAVLDDEKYNELMEVLK